MSMPGGSAPGSPGYPAGPKVRFELIGEAWRLVQQQMGTWVVAMLLVGAAIAVIYFVGLAIMMALMAAAGVASDAGGGLALGGSLASMVFSVLFGIVLNVAIVLLTGGLYRMAIKQARGEPIEVKDVLSVTDVLAPLVVTAILYGIAVGIGYVLCILPGIIAAGLMMLAIPLVVDRRATGIDALKMSFEALKPEAVMAVLFFIVVGLVAQLGVIACGVGVLVTAPIAIVSIGLLYRDVFDAGVGTPPVSPNVPPPPPPTV